jgi:hypothetical protein
VGRGRGTSEAADDTDASEASAMRLGAAVDAVATSVTPSRWSLSMRVVRLRLSSRAARRLLPPACSR